jgi:hypothetical protein
MMISTQCGTPAAAVRIVEGGRGTQFCRQVSGISSMVELTILPVHERSHLAVAVFTDTLMPLLKSTAAMEGTDVRVIVVSDAATNSLALLTYRRVARYHRRCMRTVPRMRRLTALMRGMTTRETQATRTWRRTHDIVRLDVFL